MTKCFLVAEFDTATMPPTLVDIQLAGEGWHTLTLTHKRTRFYCDLEVGEGRDYETARADLMARVDAYPGLHWVREWLKDVAARYGA